MQSARRPRPATRNEYSVGYDRVISGYLAAGFSFGTVGTPDASGNSTGETATILTVFVNDLFRLAAYGIVGSQPVPWVGFTFGYAF